MKVKIYKLYRFEFEKSEIEAFKAKREELENGEWAWVESHFSRDAMWVQAAELE